MMIFCSASEFDADPLECRKMPTSKSAYWWHLHRGFIDAGDLDKLLASSPSTSRHEYHVESGIFRHGIVAFSMRHQELILECRKMPLDAALLGGIRVA